MTSIATSGLVPVQYIGAKDRKEDNLTGSGVVWHGHGDVQPVTAAQWGLLSKHSEVWRLAKDEAESNADGATETSSVANAAKAPEAVQALGLAGPSSRVTGGLTADQVHAAKFEYPAESKPAEGPKGKATVAAKTAGKKTGATSTEKGAE